jgi:hypothetical protein
MTTGGQECGEWDSAGRKLRTCFCQTELLNVIRKTLSSSAPLTSSCLTQVRLLIKARVHHQTAYSWRGTYNSAKKGIFRSRNVKDDSTERGRYPRGGCKEVTNHCTRYDAGQGLF